MAKKPNTKKQIVSNEVKESLLKVVKTKSSEKETTTEVRTPEEEKQYVESFIKDPKMKEDALRLAYQIQKDFPGWFTITKMMLVYQKAQKELAQKIELLMLFDLCIGKVETKVPYFHIDIDKKIQAQLIKDEIAVKKGEILFLEEKLSKLK